MKKHILSFLLVLVLILGVMPSPVLASAADIDRLQAGDSGTFIDGDHVISDMIEKNGMNVHPRIIMTAERFEKLKKHIGDGSVTASLLQKLHNEADSLLEMSALEYNIPDGIRLLETSKGIQRRVAALAMAYNIFGDEEYAERCYKELEAACNFKDWNPRHFLDTAEMCTAFAFGYDWLYNWLTPERRKFLRKNMIEKGLNQVMNDYNNNLADGDRTYRWYQDEEGDNWQLVCTGGTNLAALAIGDEEGAREIAAKVITYGYERAYSFVRRAYSTIDGTYIEGLGYWDYATYYLGLQSSALVSATGTDYGLADYEGVRKSVDFIRYMSSNTPKSFSFGDDGDSRDTGWAVFQWLGQYLDSPEISAIRLRKIKNTSFNYLDALWIDEDKKSDSDNNNSTDWGSVGASNASFRNNWDESGLVAALHVGENVYFYHGHYDLGSFYIEANGSRFFTDLGNEDYELFNRQFSYRIKPEGHNTLVINPTEGTDQAEGAKCLITEFADGNEGYAITDLTEAYGQNNAKKVVRGLKMIKDKECVIIQDEISLNSPGDIYWFAHTKGTIAVAEDGRSAVVTVGSDRMWVGLISEGGQLTEMDAEPLSTSLVVEGTTDNSEYRKLAIHLANIKDTTISVACIPLKKGENIPTWIPAMKAFSGWAGVTEHQHNFADQDNGNHKCLVCSLQGKHTFSEYVTKAKTTANGRIETKCTACGNVSSKTTIYYPKTYSIEKTSYEYTGSQIKPAITVKDCKGNIVDSKYYTLSYGTNKAVGKGTVKVTFKGNYTGSNTVEFKITPKKTTISTPAIAADGITVKWTKNTSAKGYIIYRSVNGAAYEKVKTVTDNTVVSWKDTKANVNGSKYQYKIVSYKVVDGVNYKSGYSSVKTRYFVSQPTISSLTSGSAGKMTLKWGKNSKATGYQIQYSTDSSFATYKTSNVTSKDTISRTFSSLTKGKKYYVRIRSYKTVGDTKYYSAWSTKKSVTIAK